MVRCVVGSIPHGGRIELLLVPASAPNYAAKTDMCYPVYEMVHTLLLIENCSPFSGGSGFPLSLSERSVTICPRHLTVNKLC